MNERVMAIAVLLLVLVSSRITLAQPIARYTFDDGTGADASGNGFDGLLLANADAAAQVVTDPERGPVLQLNGRGMQVDGPFPIRTAFTVSTWLKIDQPRAGRAISGGPWTFRTDNQGGTEHLWVEVRYPATSFLDKYKTASDVNPQGQLDGRWHHYAFVLNDAGEFAMYFDGVRAASRDGKTKVHDFNGISSIFFGTENANFSNALKGCMDDIRLYNYAVGPEDLPELMGNLLAHYTFDDGTPSDVSGNARDGLLLGNAGATAAVVGDPLQGQVLQLNGRGMQANGLFDIHSSLTLAAWLKIDQPRSGRAISGGPWTFRTDNQGGTEHLWVEARYPAGSFLDKYKTASDANFQGQLDGRWHHYAFVLNGAGEFAMYFDGVRAASRDGKTKVHDFNGVATVFFGTENATFSNALQGSMDDIRLYNVALTADQVLLLTGYQGAMYPQPPAGAEDVPGDSLSLAWSGVRDQAGFIKLRYVLYLDTNKAAVSTATLANPTPLLVQGQEVAVDAAAPNARTACTLSIGLDPNTVHYWRVDTEILTTDAADPNSTAVLTIPGLVWNFRTEARTVVPILPLAPISSLEATNNDGEILTINGIAVANLRLGVSTFTGDPAYAGNGPEKGDNFSLATYASADGQAFIETTFAQPVTTLFLIERGGNDKGIFMLFDAQGNPVGTPLEFEPADFGDTGYTANGQAAKGIVVTGEKPFTKIQIIKPTDGTLGVDPICISGM